MPSASARAEEGLGWLRPRVGDALVLFGLGLVSLLQDGSRECLLLYVSHIIASFAIRELK